MSITRLVKRARIYSLEDGVAELTMGIAFALAGGVFLEFHNMIAVGIWFCAMFGMAWGIKRLKERVTYPRGGYVAIDEQKGGIGRRILLFAIFGLFFIANDLFTFRASQAVALTAIFFAAYAFYGVSYRMPYMLSVAACSALLGLWVYRRNDSRDIGLAFVILWEGVVLAAAGGFRMWRFIKSHPRSIEAEA